MAEDIEARTMVIQADAQQLEGMRKEGHVRGFTVFCDETNRETGEQSAPTPLGYFSLSVGF